MAVRVCLELGHEASLRTKRTPEGFTHDWEVFVRSPDGADISHYIDRVVFQLHDTFPKPKRVVRDPPYSVQESGYAGFNLPIEIHLKNRDEPKKIKFNYDLHLQQSGAAIKRVRNEPYTFQNPSDEFRKKLLKGGGTSISSSNSLHSNAEHERNSRDSFTDEKPQQLIGKPKLGGDNVKKHKTKEYRMDDVPRSSNTYEDLFNSYKTSRLSPDPKKPSPTLKIEKKDKEKSYNDKDKIKSKLEMKDRGHREDKKTKDDKNKDDKRKMHKDKDASKDKGTKRPAEKPASPSPPPKKPVMHHSPKRVSSPSNKSNSSASSKEETKPAKQNISEIKIKPQKPIEISSSKIDKKAKKEKKSHDKERDLNKKEYKKDKEVKSNNLENRDVKPKELSKESSLKDFSSKEKEKEKLPAKPEKPINKFSIENMLKDPQDAVKYSDNSKHKGKTDRERKHKHKKKDKKRDESRDKNRDSVSKEKKHKEKKSSESKDVSVPKKNETILKDLEKSGSSKNFKEKDRSQLTISPISHDTSSQSSTKSSNKASKMPKNPLSSLIEALSPSSDNDSDNSSGSDDDDMDPHKNIKTSKPIHLEPPRNESSKIQVVESKPEKSSAERNDKSNQFLNRTPKSKDKTNKQELKEEKKQRKRKSSSKDDDESPSKMSKSTDDSEPTPKKRSDTSLDGLQRAKPESSRSKTDTKVQDDGVSSSLSDNPIKCDSPIIEDSHMAEPHEISSDYMMQLQELQQRIMTLKSNEELESVVNLIAETGKYEVTKKTFDFDLCMLDRSTVHKLQELIGCASRA